MTTPKRDSLEPSWLFSLVPPFVTGERGYGDVGTMTSVLVTLTTHLPGACSIQERGPRMGCDPTSAGYGTCPFVAPGTVVLAPCLWFQVPVRLATFSVLKFFGVAPVPLMVPLKLVLVGASFLKEQDFCRRQSSREGENVLRVLYVRQAPCSGVRCVCACVCGAVNLTTPCEITR